MKPRNSRFRLAMVVAALTISSSCSLLPQRRSTEAFCNTLDEGVARMQENYSSADPDDSLGLLRATAENVGELTRIVRKLDGVAPEEIADDMHTVRELWDKQAEVAQEAAENPLGAVAASIASGVMSLGSIKAVDEFAAANCTNQVAGTAT